MARSITTAGLAALVESMVKGGPLALGLYTNVHAPSVDDTPRSYKEPTGGGYAAKTLTAAMWGVSDTTAVCEEQPFTFTGVTSPDVIRGYFVKRGDVVVWAEQFDKPFTVRLKGDTIVVVPTLTLRAAKEG